MARAEKVQAVADIKEKIQGSEAVFLAEFSGLSVAEQQTLRRGLRAGGTEYKIVKMTLARRAADELGMGEDIKALFVGPTALAFSTDPAVAAKTLETFAKDHTALVIKGMVLSGEMLPPEKVKDLASLPSREVLLSRVAGGFQAPLAKFAGLMAALPRNLATMVGQLRDRLAEAAPAPAASEDSAPEAEVGPEVADEPKNDEPAATPAVEEESNG